MRTTLNLDEAVFRGAKRYAGRRSTPLGEAVSLLVRRGLSVPCPTRRVNGLLVFDPPAGWPIVTSERVQQLDV